MPLDSKIQRELEAGAQPHCEIRSNKPRNYRIIAAVAGILLFVFGITTGVALSQKLPISQALQTETIQNYLTKTFGADFFDKFTGQQSSDTKESNETTESVDHIAESDKAATGAQTKAIWQPGMGLKWNYQLYSPPTPTQMNNLGQFDVWGIDLFDTSPATIKAIQNAGSKVICYFSAGSFEPGRLDSSAFLASDRGAALSGWPGEYWLKYKSLNVRKIMKKRLDLAQQNGCDGVDPDNMDAYNNANGWNATTQDTIDYITFLANEAQSRGLSIGIKNSLEVVSDSLVTMLQYSVNEACSQYSECSMLLPFKNAGKPVFNVEYPKGTTSNTRLVTGTKKTTSCSDPTSGGISKIIKNRILDDWVQSC